MCFETFPSFLKLKSSSVSSMTGLLHSSMETYWWASLGVPCFFFFNFNSTQKLLQFKDSFVSTRFAVCSVLIVNQYIYIYIYIYERVSSDYSAMVLVSVQRLFVSWTYLCQPSAYQKKGTLDFLENIN